MKRSLSLLLVLVMVLTMMPMTAFAGVDSVSSLRCCKKEYTSTIKYVDVNKDNAELNTIEIKTNDKKAKFRDFIDEIKAGIVPGYCLCSDNVKEWFDVTPDTCCKGLNAKIVILLGPCVRNATVYLKASPNTAQFYIRNNGVIQYEPGNYSESDYSPLWPGIIVPNALIEEKQVISENGQYDKILENIKTAPSSDDIKKAIPSFNSDSQKVVWYVIKKCGDAWHVDGVIRDKADVILTYNLKGGIKGSDQLIESKSYKEGATVIVQDAEPEKDDSNFLGWSEDSSATKASYIAGNLIEINKDMTLYAVWKKKACDPITFMYSYDGNVVGNSFDGISKEKKAKKKDLTDADYDAIKDNVPTGYVWNEKDKKRIYQNENCTGELRKKSNIGNGGPFYIKVERAVAQNITLEYKLGDINGPLLNVENATLGECKVGDSYKIIINDEIKAKGIKAIDLRENVYYYKVNASDAQVYIGDETLSEQNVKGNEKVTVVYPKTMGLMRVWEYYPNNINSEGKPYGDYLDDYKLELEHGSNLQYNNGGIATDLTIENINTILTASLNNHQGARLDSVYIDQMYYDFESKDRKWKEKVYAELNEEHTGIEKFDKLDDMTINGGSISEGDNKGCETRLTFNYTLPKTVTYDKNGAEGEVPPSVSGFKDTTILPGVGDMTKEGYKFLGWATTSSAIKADYLEGKEYQLPEGETTLYAVWQQTTFDVTYYVYKSEINPKDHINHLTENYTKKTDDWEGKIEVITGSGLTFLDCQAALKEFTDIENLKFGNDAKRLIDLYKDNYSKNGGVELVNGLTIVPFRLVDCGNGDIHVDCKIVPDSNVKFTVTYLHGTQGDFADYTIPNLIYGNTIPEFTGNVTTQHNPGYEFTGWKVGETDVVVSEITGTVTGNVTYTAQWNAIDTEYTIEWYKQNVTGDGYEKYDITTASALTATPVSITAEIADIEGFDLNESESVLSEDSLNSETVLKVYYDREKYSVKGFLDGEPQGAKDVLFGATSSAITFNAKENYHIASVKVNGSEIEFTQGKSYTYPEQSNVRGLIKIEVTTEIDKVTINANAIGTGTITSEGAIEANVGSNVVYTITPDQDSYLEDVKIDGQSVDLGTLQNIIRDGIYSFENISENHSIEAVFTNKTEILLTANSMTITYNGKEQMVEGFSGTPEGYNVKGVTATAKGTNVNEYPVTFSEIDNLRVFDSQNNDVTRKFKIRTAEGKLVIEKRNITIETGSLNKEYDGTPLDSEIVTIEGLANTDEGKVTATTTRKITNVGSSENIAVLNGDEDILANYTVTNNFGILTITEREITITAKSAELDWTGENLNVEEPGYDITSGTLAEDQIITSVTLSEGQINPGEYDTTVLNAEIGGNESNYNITYVPGRLTINKLDMSQEVSSEDYEVTYDGTTHGIIVNAPDGAEVSFDNENAFTNADVYPVNYTVTKTGYADVEGSATVTITPADLTITADSASKRYDGTALSTTGFAISAGEVVSGQSITVNVTGSQTQVGTTASAISSVVITNEEGTDVTNNYKIDYVEGTLTITKKSSHKKHKKPTTEIIDEEVPLAGVPELNKTDHFNYVKGYQDGNVKPLNNITREEVATVFYRLLTDPSRAIYFSQDEDFSDIASNRWSLNAIATLGNGKIINGYEDGTFGPTKSITRAEFAAIASRFDVLEETADNQFSDISNHWAKAYINSAAKKGWITGYQDGTFKPNQYITRAEAMTLINRVLERRVDADGLVDGFKVFPDNKENAWYYYQIIEATNYHNYADRKEMSDMEEWTEILSDKTWNE